MTHYNDMVNNTALLAIENVSSANGGIYSACYVGDSPLHGAWMRLIVRGLTQPHTLTRFKKLSIIRKGTIAEERHLCFCTACPSKKWGPICDKACPECLNGGMCHDADGDCICPPGFMGTRCETGLY